MLESRTLSSRIVLAGAAVALAAGLGVGRLAAMPGSGDDEASRANPAETRTKPVAKSDAPAAQIQSSDGVKRFMVPVSKAQPSRGAADAPVTIVEWCDVQSAKCKAVEPLLATVLKAYDGKVRLAFRHMAPLSESGQLPHEFLRLAQEQGGKFWEAHARLIALDHPPTQQDIERIAGEIRLDLDSVKSGLAKHTYRGHVLSDRVFSKMFEIEEVPAFFVNGRPLTPPFTFDRFKELIDPELKHAESLLAQGVPIAELYRKVTEKGEWKRLGASDIRQPVAKVP